jgi:hypothetical protein
MVNGNGNGNGIAVGWERSEHQLSDSNRPA